MRQDRSIEQTNPNQKISEPLFAAPAADDDDDYGKGYD